MFTHCCSPLAKLRTAVIICCLALIIGIFGYAYIVSNNNEVLTKDEILANIENLEGEDYGYTYVSSYIKKYGVSRLNSYKMNYIENQLDTDYYKDLPDDRQLAKDTVLLFLEKYYDNIDLNSKEEVTDALLKCMIGSIGDPYAAYRTQDEFVEYLKMLQTGEEFVGAGVLISAETLEIIMVLKDSGAYDAGIMADDILYAVDGKTSDDIPADELIDMLSGEKDTTVDITVIRNGELMDFTVTRKSIPSVTVYYDVMEDNIGYIQIIQFMENTYSEFTEAVDQCIERGAVALVIDVRHNPGGLLMSVIDIIDYLTPDDEDRRIASYTQMGEEYVYYTTDGHSVDLPIAVLCDEFTASSAELFTAAMRDYADEGIMDTVIVGTLTYGKGIVQNSYTLYDMSGITYTIGYYNPPCDINFDKIGVYPDITVEDVEGKDAPYERAIEEVLRLTGTNESVGAFIGAAA